MVRRGKTARMAKVNASLLALGEDHPARRFLEAFIRCREDYVGVELPPPYGEGLDMMWHSELCDHKCTLSGLLYSYVSLDVELDGWIIDSPVLTASEQSTLKELPLFLALARECKAVAEKNRNAVAEEIASSLIELARLWIQCIETRKDLISG